MARTGRAQQRGGVRLKLILAVLVLFSLLYIAWKVIPPYFANYQLEDSMRNEARFAAVNKRTQEDIQDDIFRKIKDLDIPARREDIKVETISGGLSITVNYAVPIDLPGYTFELRFHPQADNRSI